MKKEPKTKYKRSPARIYMRWSPRPNAAECKSIEYQDREIREYCESHGYAIRGRYTDEEAKGDEVDRPGLWQCLQDLQKGETLIVHRLDRLARSVYMSFDIERILERKGARLLSIGGEGTWSTTEEDKLIRRILGVLAEYQKKKQAARISAASRAHQKNGRAVGGKPPYGKQRDPDDPARLITNEVEADNIRRAVELRTQGLTLRSIARVMNEEGRTNREGGPFQHGQIDRMMKRKNVPAPKSQFTDSEVEWVDAD